MVSRARKRPTPAGPGHRGLIQNRIFKNQEMALWRALVHQVHSRSGMGVSARPRRGAPTGFLLMSVAGESRHASLREAFGL
jgi:hypothetical protein